MSLKHIFFRSILFLAPAVMQFGGDDLQAQQRPQRVSPGSSSQPRIAPVQRQPSMQPAPARPAPVQREAARTQPPQRPVQREAIRTNPPVQREAVNKRQRVPATGDRVIITSDAPVRSQPVNPTPSKVRTPATQPVNQNNDSRVKEVTSKPAKPVLSEVELNTTSPTKKTKQITPASPVPQNNNQVSSPGKVPQTTQPVRTEPTVISQPSYTQPTLNNPVTYNPSNPSWRYTYFPARYTRVTYFNFPYQTIYYSGYGYRYCDGIFYRPYNGYYQVVPAPYGMTISMLPYGYHPFFVNDDPFYYFNGTYYRPYDNGYRVTAPPVGAIVESIPEPYETLIIDGESYYISDGIQYKPVVRENGEIWYEVIKSDR